MTSKIRSTQQCLQSLAITITSHNTIPLFKTISYINYDNQRR
ncbi:hypothetical protein [Rickettsia endosymbiont of Polydrusus tereticollis]